MSAHQSVLWIEDQSDNHSWIAELLEAEFPGRLCHTRYSEGIAFPMRAALRFFCEVLHSEGSHSPACPRLVILDSVLGDDTSGYAAENDLVLRRYCETLPFLAGDLKDCLTDLHGATLLRFIFKHVRPHHPGVQVIFVSRFGEDEIRAGHDGSSALRDCPGLLTGHFRKDPKDRAYLVDMLRDLLDDSRRGLSLAEIRERLHEDDVEFFLGPLDKPYQWSDTYRRALSDLARAGEDTAAPFPTKSRPAYYSLSEDPVLFREATASHRRLPRALILGDRGTGKERFAKAIHNMWHRAGDAPFEAVNIGGVPPWSAGLAMQLRLFGGRIDKNVRIGYGCVPMAWNGTVFLDELGDAQKDVQDTLLRLIQEGEYEPVLQPADLWAAHCAFVGATNRELYAPKASFRTDVADRLAMYVVRLPAFNSEDTRSDVPIWIEKLASDNATALRASGLDVPPAFEFPEFAANVVQGYPWPGNLRELKHAIRRMQLRSKLAPSGRISLAAVVTEVARLRREHERTQDLPGSRLPQGAVEYRSVVAAAADYLVAEQKRQVSKQSIVRFFEERLPAKASLYQVQSHFDRAFESGFNGFLVDVAKEARLGLRRSSDPADEAERVDD